MYEIIVALFVACGPAYMLLGMWVGRNGVAATKPVLAGPSYDQWRVSSDNVQSSLQAVEQLTAELTESKRQGTPANSDLMLASLATVQNRLVEATASIQRALDPTLALSPTGGSDGGASAGTEAGANAAKTDGAGSVERRRTTRISYLVHQFVAPFEEKKPVDGKRFQRVQCNNLSPTGIAFIGRAALPRNVVVSLGCAASRMFMVARVVYQYPLRPSEGFGYMVGCQFIRRLEDTPAGWVEPEAAPEPAEGECEA